ncbi:uncharacterized protein A4U43_C10F3300 [Asparagus officinalis]|uniref:Uncharacterized protein n=1 Tax=Asparagus officinalis TaxID=4686 RepID=A0A5P1E0T6_ASPOF|nr:uncharacterized protein A4U43_C10F3300 [Asparagus officinalis]
MAKMVQGLWWKRTWLLQPMSRDRRIQRYYGLPLYENEHQSIMTFVKEKGPIKEWRLGAHVKCWEEKRAIQFYFLMIMWRSQEFFLLWAKNRWATPLPDYLHHQRPPWFPHEGEQHEDGDPGHHRGRNSDREGGAHGGEAEDAAVEDGGVEGRPTGGEVGAGA